MNREQILRECVVDNSYKWPKQLVGSGVMFYKGERITLSEFIEVAKVLKGWVDA